MEHCSPYPRFGFRVTFVKRGQCAPRKHFEAANHLNFTCNRQDLRFKIILRLLFREGQISKRRCTILVPVQSNLVSLEEDELTSYKKKKKNSQFEILNSKRKKTKEHDYSSMKLKEKYRGEIRRIEAKSKEYFWTSRKHRWKKERARPSLFSRTVSLVLVQRREPPFPCQNWFKSSRPFPPRDDPARGSLVRAILPFFFGKIETSLHSLF